MILSLFDNPSADHIDLDDLVHRLARAIRWGGNFQPVSYSVAQHSMVVASACQLPASRPYALLHDAAKARTGDLPRDFKLWLVANGADVIAFERRYLAACWQRFGLERPSMDIARDIDLADERAYATEYRDIVSDRAVCELPTRPPLSTVLRFVPTPKIEDQYRAALTAALRPFGKLAA